MKRAMRAALASAAVLLGGACFAENTELSDEAGTSGEAVESSESTTNDPGQTSTEEGGAEEETTAADDGDASTGEPIACGNGLVDADEECDGGEGCDDTCNLVNYMCNPYNQVGCVETQTCDLTRAASLDDQNTGCFQQGLAERGDPCAYNSLDPNLQCGDGWSCVGSAYVPGCEGLVECCTELCIIGGEPCSDPEQQCLSWKEPTMPPGLEELGLCIRL